MFLASTVHVKCKTSKYVISKKLLFGDPNLCGSVFDLSYLTAHEVIESLILCIYCRLSFEENMQSFLKAE